MIFPLHGRQPASFAQPEFGLGRYDALRWQTAETEQTLHHLVREGYRQTMQGDDPVAKSRSFRWLLRLGRAVVRGRRPPVEP